MTYSTNQTLVSQVLITLTIQCSTAATTTVHSNAATAAEAAVIQLTSTHLAKPHIQQPTNIPYPISHLLTYLLYRATRPPHHAYILPTYLSPTLLLSPLTHQPNPTQRIPRPVPTQDADAKKKKCGPHHATPINARAQPAEQTASAYSPFHPFPHSRMSPFTALPNRSD